MENASKALIIAAEVLIGVIILSIGAALFVIFSNYSKTTVEQMEETKIAEFNNIFLKYENQEVTAHDIISIANYAKENNIRYELENQNEYTPSTNYVQIDVKLIKSKLEKETEEYKNSFLKNYAFEYESDGITIKLDSDGQPKIKKFTCRIEISPITKRVMYVEFKEKK